MTTATGVAAASAEPAAETGLQRARREVEDLARALRQTEAAASTAAGEVEALRTKRAARRKEREAAKAAGEVTIERLRGWDGADAEDQRRQELAVAAAQRAERELETAKRAVGDARDRLRAMERMPQQLKQSIADHRRHLLWLRSDLAERERLVGELRGIIAQHESHLAGLVERLTALTGEEVP